MATLSWNDGRASFFSPHAWTPATRPAAGDTLYIETGTATARWSILSGLTLYLQGSPAVYEAQHTAPVLILDDSIIGRSTTIHLGGSFASGYVGTTATIDARGFDLNLGVITNGAFIGEGPIGPSSQLTIAVGGAHHGGVFVNAGTLSVTAGFVSPSTLTVHGASGTAALVNEGLISDDGIVKLDINVVGEGRISFGAVFFQSTLGPPDAPTLEATKAVSAGQTIDFAGSGKDSHGTLILDDPSQFHGRITNFVASTGNILTYTHTDEVVLKGVDVSSFAWHGNTQGGVLTLREGAATVARLNFAGSHTTASFEVTHPTATSSIVKLVA